MLEKEEEEEGRKDKRQWEKKERGKSVAVVLVSSQVKDLINMGARSQQPTPSTTLPLWPPPPRIQTH